MSLDSWLVICLQIVVNFLLMTQAQLECPNITDPITTVPFIDEALYSYNVQVILKGENKTYDLFEFYDNSTQSLYRYVDGDNFTHVAWTYDYKMKQVFSVETGNNGEKSCRVGNLSCDFDEKSIFHDNFNISNPGDSEYNFYWNQPYNATKQKEVDLGDGNLLDRYESCLLFDNSTIMYQLHIYFRTNTNIPTLISLHASQLDGNVTTTSVTNFEFSSFRSSQHKQTWKPSHPHGVICQGRKDSPNITLPTQGDKLHIITREIYDDNTPISTQLYIDLEKKLSRIDINDETKYIMDYNQGLMFKSTTNKCTISPIPSQCPFNNQTIAHGIFMSSDHIIPELNSLNHYKYGGKIPHSHDITYQYISTNQQGSNSLFISAQGQLIGIQHSNDENLVRISLMDDKVSWKDFDVTSCFSHQPSNDLTIQFSLDQLQHLQQNFNNFKESLLDVISRNGNMSRLRLSDNVRYYIADEKVGGEKKLFVIFTAFPLISGGNGDDVVQSNTSEAVGKLSQIINNNELKISFHDQYNNKTIEMIAFPNYLLAETDLITGAPTPSPSSSGLSNAAAIALSFACLLIGGITGGSLLLWKQRRSTTFNYSAFDTA